MKIYILIPLLLTSALLNAQAYDPNQSFPTNSSVQPAAGFEPGQAPRGGSGSNLLLNGGMETNGGDGSVVINDWTITNATGSMGGTASGSFVAYNTIASPIGGQALELPTEGLFAAVSDTAGPTSNILYQDITIPANGASLSCDIFFNNQSGTNVNAGNLDWQAAPNQHARIDIMNPSAAVDDTGAGVLQNLFITEAADPAAFSYTAFTANLSAFSNQTVRLRFAEVNNQFFQNFAVDNCSIIALAPPIPVPSLSVFGLLILMIALFALMYNFNHTRSKA
jgi:hypothetical protein